MKKKNDSNINSPQVMVSWGELFDKITILQIKLENLKTKSALRNVKKEHDQLCTIFDHNFFPSLKEEDFSMANPLL